MAHEIVVPRLGWSMEEGTFVAWLKRDGEPVRVGDPLYELEGEKASQEIESVDAGILRIPPTAPQPGDTVLVGAAIGYLVAEGESLPWLSGGDAVAPVAIQATAAAKSVASPAAPTAPALPAATSTVVASPRAKRVAREMGVDWTQLTGSGAHGRIREQDVRAATPQRTTELPSTSTTRIPITAKRRIIAERLTSSRQQTVPVTLQATADATNLVNLRTQFKLRSDTATIPSYQDILTKLVAALLERHPLVAGRWDDDAIVLPGRDGIHLGMAVDTPHGLLVPVIAHVCRLSLIEVAAQSQALVQKARAGQLTASEMQGGVFTITNLGAFGVEHFTPIINLPETAILGVGTIRLEPVVSDTGELVARLQIRLSLTFDHRVIDGAPAAKFLQDLTAAIANPSAWLLA